MSAIRQFCMEPRRDWNALGPKLPAWFRVRLQRIDPLLVLQFIPPRSIDRERGVDPFQFPEGVWTICRRMKATRWLFKRWTWSLTDQHGRYQPPGPDTVRLIQMAHGLWKRGRAAELEKQFDATCASIRRQQSAESRCRLRSYLDALCRKYDYGFGTNHVFFPESPLHSARRAKVVA